MDKRLAKRHKRQVARAREKHGASEPDLRSPEEIKAAREASRPADGHANGPNAHAFAPSSRTNRAPSIGSAAKTAV
jgi:hypothetical protein